MLGPYLKQNTCNWSRHNCTLLISLLHTANVQVCARTTACVCVCEYFWHCETRKPFVVPPLPPPFPSPNIGFSAGQLPNCAAVLLRSLGFGCPLSLSLPGLGALWHLYATHHPTRHAHRPPQCSLQLAAHFD